MEERLAVITPKAVRNDDKQSEIKGRDKNKPLKSSPQISKISSPQPRGIKSTVQLFLSTMVPAPTAEKTHVKEQACAGNTETLAKCLSPPS